MPGATELSNVNNLLQSRVSPPISSRELSFEGEYTASGQGSFTRLRCDSTRAEGCTSKGFMMTHIRKFPKHTSFSLPQLITHRLPQGTEAHAGYVADLRGNAELLLIVRKTKGTMRLEV